MLSRHLAPVLGMFFCLVLAASPALAENWSLLFDGTNDYVTVPDPINPTGPLTMEAWVKLDADPSGGRVVSHRDGAEGYEMDAFKFGDTYEFRFTINSSAVVYTFVDDPVGRWVHMAVTWGGTSDHLGKIYIDGAFRNDGFREESIVFPSGPLRIGSAGGGALNFRGQIDEVRVWSAALDGATIAAWMSRPLTTEHPDYANLEGYWNFDEGSGQVVHNLAGDARRDGELGSGSGEDTSDPQWQRDGAPVPVAPATVGQIKQLFLKP